MVDELFDRTYQSGRAELNSGIDRTFAAMAHELGKGLKTLQRIQWSAPWARPAKDA